MGKGLKAYSNVSTKENQRKGTKIKEIERRSSLLMLDLKEGKL